MQSLIKTALCSVLISTVPVFAAEKPATAPDTKLAFLFVRPEVEGSFVKAYNGMYAPAPEKLELKPPQQVFLRQGESTKEIPVAENTASLPVNISGEVDLSALLMENPAPVDTTTTGGPKAGHNKKTYGKLVSLPEAVARGGEWLVCVFKSPGAARWAPPRVSEIPISDSAFSSTSMAVVNAGDVAVSVEDATGKFTSIPSGTTGLVPLRKSEDGLVVRVAYRRGQNLVVLANMTRSASPESKLVMIVNETISNAGKHSITYACTRVVKNTAGSTEKTPAKAK